MKLPRLKPMLPQSRKVDQEALYVHEIKWDGFRALAYLEKEVILMSRGGGVLNARFPQILPELQVQGQPAILDGEIVALNEQGLPEFSLLAKGGNAPLIYVVFDLLYWRGDLLCPLPWRERRRLLEEKLAVGKAVILSPLLPGGQAYCLQLAKNAGLEGIVSKHVDSPYLPGKRSSFWRKQKIQNTLDCVVAGLQQTNGRIKSFSAALYDQQGSLLFIGQVGTGLSGDELVFLDRAASLLASKCPVINPPKRANSVLWLKPHLVATIHYLEFTPRGRLRHPVFVRFRFDKKASTCILRG